MPIIKQIERKKKKYLISIVGNIASGKSTIAKKIQKETGYKLFEINQPLKCYDYMIIESSGIGKNIKSIYSKYEKIKIIKCECDESIILSRLEKRKIDGYIYPINTKTPKHFYYSTRDLINRIKADETIKTN